MSSMDPQSSKRKEAKDKSKKALGKLGLDLSTLDLSEHEEVHRSSNNAGSTGTLPIGRTTTDGKTATYSTLIWRNRANQPDGTPAGHGRTTTETVAAIIETVDAALLRGSETETVIAAHTVGVVVLTTTTSPPPARPTHLDSS